MPWDSIEDLPLRVTEAIPSTEGREKFLGAFNSCMADGGDDEKCFPIAYGAAKRKADLPVGKALEIAKTRLPGWAWSTLQTEEFSIPSVQKKSLSLMEVTRLFCFAKTQAARGKSANLGVAPVYAEAIIKKLNNARLQAVALTKAEAVLPGWAYAVLRETIPNPTTAEVIFISKTPLSVECNTLLKSMYLPVLGNPYYSIHLIDDDGDLAPGAIAIGLGKEARALNPHAMLPHPQALLSFGDKGEVARKSIRVKNILDGARLFGIVSESGDRLKAPHTCEDGEPADLTNSRSVSIVKAVSSKQIVVGVVLAPWTEDSQGDVISASDIELSAHDYVEKSGTMGVEHRKTAHGAKAVESYLVPYPTKDDYDRAIKGEPHQSYRLTLGDDSVTSGSWILSVKLPDDLWGEYEKGELGAFSIGGFGKREPFDSNLIPAITYKEP